MISRREGAYATLFSYRIDTDLDWAAVIGADRLRAAFEGDGPVTTAIPAGRWGDEVSYAVLARIERGDASSCLCAMRHRLPFDALEASAARAGAQLMADAIESGRDVAAAERVAAAHAAQRSVRAELERPRDPAALARAAAQIAESIDANGASIMLVDGQELHLRAAVGLPGGVVGHRQRIGDGIAGWVAKSGETMELRGRVADDRFVGTDPDAGTALIIPLRVGPRIIGVLSVKRTAGAEDFDADDRALATDLADELARAVGSEPTAAKPASEVALPDSREPEPERVRRASAPFGNGSSGQALRVLAVEDHPLMRLGIRSLLEREGLVLAALSATSAEAVEHARHGQADVALVDLGLPDSDGVEVIERLHAAAPDLPVIAYSIEGGAERVRAAVRAGAVGYLTKAAPATRVVAALRAAASGLSALGPEEAFALAEQRDGVDGIQKSPTRTVHVPTEPAAEPQADALRAERPKEALSPRELELLRYLAEGYTNKEIARAMVLAEDTVKKGVQMLIAKLGATDRTHAVVLALRSSLIE